MPDFNEDLLTYIVAYQRELSAPQSSQAAPIGAATNTKLEDAARGT